MVFKVSKSGLKDFYSIVNTFILLPKFRNGRLVVQKKPMKTRAQVLDRNRYRQPKDNVRYR